MTVTTTIYITTPGTTEDAAEYLRKVAEDLEKHHELFGSLPDDVEWQIEDDREENPEQDPDLWRKARIEDEMYYDR